MQQHQPKNSQRVQQSPQQRLLSLQAQLSQLELLKQITEHESFSALLSVMEAEGRRRKQGIFSIHWDSDPAAFQSYEKRALYAAGYIQGCEYGANVLKAVPQQHAQLTVEINSLAKEIKQARSR